MIFANLMSFGNDPQINDLLKMWVSGFTIYFIICLTVFMLISSCPYEVLLLHPDTMSSTSCSVTGCIYIDCDTKLFTGFVPGLGSIRLDKCVPMSTKNLLKWLAISLLSNTTRFSPIRNSLEYFVSDFLLPIMLVRIFQVSLVLVLQSSSFFYNSSSFLDVRVLLTCFCTFCSDFLLILTYILETLSTGFFLYAGIF